MITPELIDTLHCPYCGSAFQMERQVLSGNAIQYGVVRCGCYRYPIVEGIAILRQNSGPSDTSDQAVDYVLAGEFEKAFRHVFYRSSPIQMPKSRWRRALELMQSSQDAGPRSLPNPATLYEALQIHRPGGYGTYLFHRHANSSFLAAIPLLLLLNQVKATRGAVRFLDLNCGIGHASFLTTVLFPEISVFATDHDFVNLYLARHYMVPQTPCFCLDAELPLPFPDRFFDAALCMDGLHYVRSKRALLKELDRCLEELGLWLFPHLHNALGSNVSPGVPLRPDDYRRCLDFLPAEIFSEKDLLRNFVQDQVLDLSAVPPHAQVDGAPVLSIVASRDTGIWRRHEGLADQMLRLNGNLKINPIYQSDRHASSNVGLRMHWPNPALERECESVKEFLPPERSIEPSLWQRLQEGRVMESDRPAIEPLIRDFVVVPLPNHYS